MSRHLYAILTLGLCLVLALERAHAGSKPEITLCGGEVVLWGTDSERTARWRGRWFGNDRGLASELAVIPVVHTHRTSINYNLPQLPVDATVLDLKYRGDRHALHVSLPESSVPAAIRLLIEILDETEATPGSTLRLGSAVSSYMSNRVLVEHFRAIQLDSSLPDFQNFYEGELVTLGFVSRSSRGVDLGAEFFVRRAATGYVNLIVEVSPEFPHSHLVEAHSQLCQRLGTIQDEPSISLDAVVIINRPESYSYLDRVAEWLKARDDREVPAMRHQFGQYIVADARRAAMLIWWDSHVFKPLDGPSASLLKTLDSELRGSEKRPDIQSLKDLGRFLGAHAGPAAEKRAILNQFEAAYRETIKLGSLPTSFESVIRLTVNHSVQVDISAEWSAKAGAQVLLNPDDGNFFTAPAPTAIVIHVRPEPGNPIRNGKTSAVLDSLVQALSEAGTP